MISLDIESFMAKDEAEFDELFAAFISYRADHSYDEIKAYQQSRVDVNKEKLSIK